MKQFNLTQFETYPDGSVVLYSRDGQQMKIHRIPTGTRVLTAVAPAIGDRYSLGPDGSLAEAQAIHRAKISDIPFKPAASYWSSAVDDGRREILI